MGQLLLVVDNSRTVCRAVQLVFHASVYDVISAPTASGALQLARSRRPAAVIIAYHLPDASGFALARRFRADADLSDVPILMLTGRYHAYDPSEVSRCGANGSIAKPFKTDDLIAALAQAVSRPSARAPQYTPDISTVSPPQHSVDEESIPLVELAPAPEEQPVGTWGRAAAIPMPEPSTYVDPDDAFERDQPAFQGYGSPAAPEPQPAPAPRVFTPAYEPLPAPEPLEPTAPPARTAPPAIPRTASGPQSFSPSASDGPAEAAAFRRVKPAGPPPPPNVPRRTFAPPPPAEVHAPPAEERRGFDTGPRVFTQPVEPVELRDETAQVPAVAAHVEPATQPQVAAPTLAATDTTPTTPTSVAVVAAAPQAPAASADLIDPAQLRVIVREAVAPLVREALPAIVKEFVSSMLRQTGQKLDEYSRQRIDSFVANDLPKLADDAIANSLRDVPQMAREAIDRQLHELTGGDA